VLNTICKIEVYVWLVRLRLDADEGKSHEMLKTSGENSTTPSNELLAWQNCFRMQDSFAGK